MSAGILYKTTRQYSKGSIYFYLAIFEALADIRTRWPLAKDRIRKAADNNDNLTEKELRYPQFVLKSHNCFATIQQEREV